MCPETPPLTGAGLRVAAIPCEGPYVDAVLPDAAVRVGDGDAWLDADHLAAHAGDVDVVHLHAGAGHGPLTDPDRWTATLRRLDVPLVVTVHRLNPHNGNGNGNGRADGCLAAVLADAEVVLTLTPGAAAEIAERYGRTAIVVAHPSVAAPRPGLGAERGLVGLRLGRPSSAVRNPELLLRAALSGAVSGGGRLRVLDEGADLPAARALAAEGVIELVEAGREDTDRAAQLQQLHVAVLPERCGTHSRDLEVCRDVGTRVVAPGCGWFAEQWSEVVTYGTGPDDELDPVSLAAAIGAALARSIPRPADRVWREEQRAAAREVHAQVYAQVAAARRTA